MPSGQLPDPHVELCPLCYTVLHDKLWAKMGECSHSYHLKCLLSAFVSENAHNSQYVICPACRLAVVSGTPASERKLRKKLSISDPPPELQHIHAPRWKLESHQLVPGQSYHGTNKASPPRGPGMLSRARLGPGTSARQRLVVGAHKNFVGAHNMLGTHNIFAEGVGSSAKLPPGPIKLQPRMPVSVSELLGRPRSAPARRIGHASPHMRAMAHSRSMPAMKRQFAIQARQGLGAESPWGAPVPAGGSGESGWAAPASGPWAAPASGPASSPWTAPASGPWAAPASGPFIFSAHAGASGGTAARPRNLFKIHRPIKRRNYLARHAAIVRRQRAQQHPQLDP